MYFQDDKVGYSHFKIEPSGEDFSISSDSILRLTAMKKTDEISQGEKVQVRPDLAMVSFRSSVRKDGRHLLMEGTIRGEKLHVTFNVDGEILNKEYPVDGTLYHTSAISLFPALRGLEEGRKYSFKVFNPEKQRIENVEQEVTSVKGPAGPNGAVWTVRNSYGKSVILSWLDQKGLAVLEKALDGALITMLEDQTSAEGFLKQWTRQRDIGLDVGLIRVAKRIPAPEKVQFLKVRIQGIDASQIAEDHRQRIISRSEADPKGGFQVSVQVEDVPGAGSANREEKRPGQGRSGLDSTRGAPADPVKEEHLASTVVIQADHKEIIDQASRIVSPDDNPVEQVRKLTHWTAKNIEKKMKDTFSALTVLRSREGECQSHAYLYASLARSLKIPTRVVSGMVYSDKMGFLYHAWAESYVNGWISVDPTLNQIPADATHIKISTGESADEAQLLLKMVGKVKMEVLDFH
ncbi:MAG: transglutaminase domain-containing protein [Deltaproteobacteria bacterium]|nr:transglutaminase domain-containing protein [Deltaproteobacteria bacterium]